MKIKNINLENKLSFIKRFFLKKYYPIILFSLGSIFTLLTFFFLLSHVKIENLRLILTELNLYEIFIILFISSITLIIDSYYLCYVGYKNHCHIPFKLSLLLQIGKVYLKFLFFSIGNIISDILKCYIFRIENQLPFKKNLLSIYIYRIILFISEILYSFIGFYIALFSIYSQKYNFYPSYLYFLPIFVILCLIILQILIIKIFKLKITYSIIQSILKSLKNKSMLKFLQKIAKKKVIFKEFRIELRQFFLQQRFTLSKIIISRMCIWIFEAVEIYIILQFLSHPISFPIIVIIQILRRFIRNLFFFLSRKLGIQELIYAFLFELFHIPQALELSIILALIQRAKDLIHFILGFFVSLYLTKKYPLIKKIKDIKINLNK